MTPTAPYLPAPPPPTSLSAAILLALEDLGKTEADSRFIINMAWFWLPLSDHTSRCEVCFAGSVMAQTLHADPRVRHRTYNWGPGWGRIFWALDSIRQYSIRTAIRVFYGSNFLAARTIEAFHASLTWEEMRDHTLSYPHHPAIFKSNMRAIATWLASHDL